MESMGTELKYDKNFHEQQLQTIILEQAYEDIIEQIDMLKNPRALGFWAWLLIIVGVLLVIALFYKLLTGSNQDH